MVLVYSNTVCRLKTLPRKTNFAVTTVTRAH